MRLLNSFVLILQCLLIRGKEDEATSSSRNLRQTSPKVILQSDSENSQVEGPFLVDYIKSLSAKAESGITISRTIDSLEDGVELLLSFEGATCKEEDEHGRNNCHYNWGDDFAVNVTVNTNGTPFEAGDNVVGKFKVDYIIPWKFDCQVCGEDCTLNLPVINQGVTFPSPPCPFANDADTVPFVIPLGDTSPVRGIPTHFSGHMSVKRAGKVVARMSVDSTVV